MENKRKTNCVAFDCGNSSIRVVAGIFDGERIDLEVVHKVSNHGIELNGIIYWDVINIFNELQKGLQKAYLKYGNIDSVGICTWGIDFGLFSEHNQLIGNPLSYRNNLGEKILDELTDEEKRFMFDNSGIQNSRINSIYQLLGIKKYLSAHFDISNEIFLMPDLLINLFTRKKITERTIASTTQVFNIEEDDYSKEILNYYKLNRSMFQNLVNHGELIGYINNSISEQLNINSCPVICVPSHDTASAVTAIPVDEEEFIFISSGTWSLIGAELNKPILSDYVYKEQFANEAGVFNTVTLLKNSNGLFILQEIKREIENAGKKISWDDIINLAKSVNTSVPVFNPNNEGLFNPKSMINVIKQLIKDSGFGYEVEISHIINSAYRSLATCYSENIKKIEGIIGSEKDKIYIAGGGSKDEYLNQLTADATGKTVIAGPDEATSLGNILIQLKYHNPQLELKNMRNIIKKTIDIKQYFPSEKLNI